MPKKRKKRGPGKDLSTSQASPESPPETHDSNIVFNEGLAAYHNDNMVQARECFRQAAELDPTRADAHSMIGVINLNEQNIEGARDCFRAACNLDSETPNYRFNLALAHYMLGDVDKAAELARVAIALRPDYSEAWNTLGMALNDQEDWTSAKNAFEKAVHYHPDYGTGWVNLCGALREIEDFDASLKAGLRSVELEPGMAQAYYNLAHCYDAMEKHDLSIIELRKCIELDPKYANAYSNLCRSLTSNAEYAEAVQIGRIAIEQNPKSCFALVNLGLALSSLAKHQESVDMYLRAIEIDPDNLEAHNNLAHATLSLENFSYGWEEYEYGIIKGHRTVLATDTPTWEGEPVAGKRIHVVGEQGIGEQIMFATMIPELIAQGAEITYECEARLAPIFARSCPTIAVEKLTGTSHSSIGNAVFDYKTLVGSIGRWNRTKVSCFKPFAQYLYADPTLQTECRARYQALGSGPVIGISWKSKTPRHKDTKDVTLANWQPIFDAARGATFVSVQYGDVAEDVEFAKRELGVDIFVDPNVDAMESLEQSAAQIAAVDFIVTISNATVHLSGALGVPTLLIASPFPPWHWFLERRDSLWYESITIFRQNFGEDWSNTISDVTNALPPLLASFEKPVTD